MINYLLGFGTCAILWAAFHFGWIQPKIKALRDAAERNWNARATPKP